MRRVVSLVPLLALGLGAAVALIYARVGATGWDAFYAQRLTRSTGWCALIALLLSLSCSPARRLLRMSRMPEVARESATALPALRRSLGMTSAVFAAAHALIGLFGPLGGALLPIWTWTYLRAGLVAFAVLALLFATSSPRLNRRLRVREFKPLHRLVYAALPSVLLHVALGPFSAAWATLMLACVSVGLLALRLGTRARGA